MPKNDKPVFRFRGGRRTVEETTRRSKRSGGGYDSIINTDFPTFKPKEGENVIRIMPPTWADDKWGDYWDVEVWVHYNVGAQGGAYLCLDKMKGEPCPVCAAAKEAADREEARQFSANVRALVWLIDRNDEKAGPLAWAMPNKVYKEINARSKDKKTGAVILIDQVDENSYDGYDITFNLEKKGSDSKNVDYTGVEIDRDETPLHDDQKVEDRWMKYITDNPLPDILNFYDAGYIEKVLTGRAEPKEEEEEGGEAEQESSSTRRASRRTEPEEMEEEEPPTTRRGRRQPEPEEEEEPEAPRSRRSRQPESEEEENNEAEEEASRGRSNGRRLTNREAEEANEEAEAAEYSARRRRPQESEEAEEENSRSTAKVSAEARRKLERMKQRHAR